LFSEAGIASLTLAISDIDDVTTNEQEH